MAVRIVSKAARAIERTLARDDYARGLRVGWAGPSDPARKTLPAVLLLLTFTTGLVDAVSYLALGQVFTAFQTGNLVVLGFALAGTEGFSIAPPAVSVAGFFAGAALGGLLATHSANRHRRWFSGALAIESVLVALAAAAAAGILPNPVADRSLLIVALLAAAMGLRNATIRSLSAPDVTTTVLTSTLTDLAASSEVGSRGVLRRAWQVSTIVARVLGAVAGALLLGISLVVPLLVLAALSIVAAAAYVAPVVVRRLRRRRRGSGRA